MSDARLQRRVAERVQTQHVAAGGAQIMQHMDRLAADVAVSDGAGVARTGPQYQTDAMVTVQRWLADAFTGAFVYFVVSLQQAGYWGRGGGLNRAASLLPGLDEPAHTNPHPPSGVLRAGATLYVWDQCFIHGWAQLRNVAALIIVLLRDDIMVSLSTFDRRCIWDLALPWQTLCGTTFRSG